MKVGIDTFGCDHGNSNAGLYLLSIAKLLRSGGDMEFEFFGEEEDLYLFNRDNNIDFVPVRLSGKRGSPFWWHVIGFNAFCKIQKYDVVVIPAAMRLVPFCPLTPTVAIVTDTVPGSYKKERLLRRMFIRAGLKSSGRVVVPSRFMKRSLGPLRIKQKKISVIHNGIDHSVFRARTEEPDPRAEPSTFSVKKPYFICVSPLSSPEKHHRNLIRAYSLFRGANPGFKHRLVLAGGEGGLEEVRGEIAASPFASDILVTGCIPHDEFPALYSGAEGAVFLPDGEGAGMAVVEAMATGVPVACSRGGALSEIAGDSALFFDGQDVHDIAEKLALVARKDKKSTDTAAGIAWARRFDWARTCEELLAEIRSLAKK